MADTSLRVLITGDSAGAVTSFEETAAAADAAGAEMESKVGGAVDRTGNLFTKLGTKLESMGIPGAAIFSTMGEKIDDANVKTGSFGETLSSIGGVATLALGAGFAVAAGEGLHLAIAMQTVDTKIANSADISSAAAKKIGTTFLGTAFSTIYSGQQIGTAYASVAGQLGTVEGHALTSSQAMTVMSASMDLAEASGTSLTGSTKSLGAVMQAYGEKVTQAAKVSNNLYEAARLTGQSVTSVGSAVDKVKTKLGGLAPPITQVSGLLADMTAHGETGRAAMSSLTTAFTAFLKPAVTVTKANNDLEVATKALTPALAGYAKQVQAGTLAGTALSSITSTMTAKQQALWSQFTSSNTAVTTASEAYAKLGVTALTTTGKLKPLATIIGQLHKQITGMSTAQATAQLSADGFGSSASKLVKVVQAGPEAYDKYVAEVSKTNAAHDAAAKQAATLKDQLEALKVGIEDEATKFGQVLLPILEDVGHVGADVIDFFIHCEPAAIALAAIIGGPLVLAIGKFAYDMGTSAVQAAANYATSLAHPIQAITGSAAAADEADASQAAFNDTLASLDETLGLIAVSLDKANGSVIELIEPMETAQQNTVVLSEATQVLTDAWIAAQTAAQEVDAALILISGNEDTAAGSTASMTGYVDELGAAWTSLQAQATTAMSDIDASTAAMASSIEASTGAADGALAGMGASAEGAGADAALAGGAEGIGAVTEGIGGMLGPVGLAAGVVVGLGSALFGMFHSGTSAAAAATAAVTALNKKIAQMPTTTVLQMTSDLQKLATQAAAATATMGKTSFGSTAYDTASAKVQDLTQKSISLSQQMTTQQANVATLSAAFGVNASQVQAAARAANITLKQGLDTSKIQLFRQGLEQAGAALTMTKVDAAGFAAGVANSSKQAAAAAQANDPLLATSAKTAMELRVAIMQKTGAAAIADLVNSTKGGLPDVEAVAAQYGVDIPQKYMTLLKQALTDGGHISVTRLATAIDDGKAHVGTSARGLVTATTPALDQIRTKMATTGETAMNKLIIAMSDPGGKLSATTEAAIVRAINAVNKHSGDLGKTGTQLMAGLAAGITSGSGQAVQAAIAAVTAAITAANAKAGVKSPSVVMMQTGDFLMQGLGLGIDGGAPGAAAKATQAMSQVLAATSGNSLHAIAAAVASGGTSNPATIGTTPAGGASSGATGPGGTAVTNLTVLLQVNGQTLATAVAPELRTLWLQEKRATVTLGLS